MTGTILIYINSFAVLVLMLVLKNYRWKLKSICCEEKVFVLFIWATLFMLVNEAAIENLWLKPGWAVRFLLYGLQTVDYMLAVVIPLLWLYYCLFRIYHISSVKKKLRLLIALPAALYVLMLLVTLPGGAAYSIDENNLYHSGIVYPASFVFGFLYIAAAILLIVSKRSMLNRGEMIPYLLIPAIPVLLAIGEILWKPLTGLMWAGVSLVILEVQMLVLNNRTNIDHLTSLNNRMALDAYLRRMIHESHTLHTRLGVMMIDVDEFKSINDRYGHVEGDKALKATAEILRDCFAGKHFIARYGGDEFTVVVKDCSGEQMAAYYDKLQALCIRHNGMVNRPYGIMLSIGSWVFTEQEITSLHSLYIKVDDLMYQEKNFKKAQKADAP